MEVNTNLISNSFVYIMIIILLSSHYTMTEPNEDKSSNLQNSLFFYANDDYNFTNAGSSNIAIIGEPLHMGDSGKATILVHNSGEFIDSVKLIIEEINNDSIFMGDYVQISPGSSKEISVTFTPNYPGFLEFRWSVYSPNGGVDSSLNGIFELTISPPQTLILSPISYSWDLSNSLEAKFSLSLTQGKSRILVVNIYGGPSNDNPIYSSRIIIDSGYRTFDVDLGNPEYSVIRIEAIPYLWTPNMTNSLNITTLEIISPYPDLIITLNNYYPKTPERGENITFEFTIVNNGKSQTSIGLLRVIMPDQTILHEETLPQLQSGSSYSGTILINQWNYGQNINATLTWYSDGFNGLDWIIVTSSENDDINSNSIDFFSLFYGSVAGFSIVLVAKVAIGAFSNRTPSTAPGKALRMPRKTRTKNQKLDEIINVQIKCPICEQKLNVPKSHLGLVKCPSCTTNFDVSNIFLNNDDTIKEVVNEKIIVDNSLSEIKIVNSSNDMLDCPDCSQKLKVPLEKRPVRARCPACRSEFMASKDGE